MMRNLAEIFTTDERNRALVPGSQWNEFVGELRRSGNVQSAGSLVAQATIIGEHGRHLSETYENFVMATEPPLTAAEQSAFLDAFRVAEPLQPLLDADNYEGSNT